VQQTVNMLTHLPPSPSDFYEIMDMLDKRLNDKGKNWRHVLKSLKVLDYCLHEGSELVVTWARKNIYIIKTLREFQYVDEEGRDVGQNGRLAQRSVQRNAADGSKFVYLRRNSPLSFLTKTVCVASALTASCGRLALQV
jgi:ENTH domain